MKWCLPIRSWARHSQKHDKYYSDFLGGEPEHVPRKFRLRAYYVMSGLWAHIIALTYIPFMLQA